MLGHRGCRLAITFPEIYEVQATAIGQAVAQVKAEGIDVSPEIMIPLVMVPEELRRLRVLVAKAFEAAAPGIPYTIGTMIELPRAASGGSHRRARRLLLVRDQRPHADHVWSVAR